MAVNANTFVSTNGVLNRENLIDLYYTVGNEMTPFYSSCKKTSSANVLHEWGVESLAEPVENAALEADSFDIQTLAVPKRLNNKTQIFKKVIGVSDTQMAINSAGAIHSLANNLKRTMKELKRDIEKRLLTGSRVEPATSSVGIKLRGVDGWLAANLNMGTGGVAPDYGSANTARQNGTARAFAESQLKDVIAKIWSKGGTPDTILCSFSKKQAFSGFNTTPYRDANVTKYTAHIDMYVSDNGMLKIIPAYNMPASSVYVLQMDTWRVANLRDIKQIQLPKNSDSTAMAIVTELTLESLNEAANGAVHDLS